MTTVILICSLSIVPKIMGYQGYEVISGSMEPEIKTGSIVYVKKVNPITLKTGDVVTFYDALNGQILVTHRVVENHTNEKTLTTKGDANEKNDLSDVQYRQVVGIVGFHLPIIGGFLNILSTIQGKLTLILIFIIGIYMFSIKK